MRLLDDLLLFFPWFDSIIIFSWKANSRIRLLVVFSLVFRITTPTYIIFLVAEKKGVYGLKQDFRARKEQRELVHVCVQLMGKRCKGCTWKERIERGEELVKIKREGFRLEVGPGQQRGRPCPSQTPAETKSKSCRRGMQGGVGGVQLPSRLGLAFAADLLARTSPRCLLVAAA